ncbi:hypothetical protein GMRT_10531 [Giardia muris]|uniref:Uncharacterized protein n=1 Tax=Giardia muris TaxID=5742 RepID=A0A4Z1T2U7_GIAMU|nr:hypothetical protein GMRT_10531 [Giardia muris]|eukprot:TNJ26889.1 hypothetical protein GMRT_10531 [Giardia muris]
MAIKPESNALIVIVANKTLIDSQGAINNGGIKVVEALLKRGMKVVLVIQVSSDAMQQDYAKKLTGAISELPAKNCIFCDSIDSIYSICRQLEPKFVVDSFEKSYNETQKFFAGRYFLSKGNDLESFFAL